MQSATKEEIKENAGLSIQGEESVRSELGLVPAEQISLEQVDGGLKKQADDFVKILLSDDHGNNDKREAIDGLGLKTQQEAGHRSKMLEQPIRSLAKTGDDGGPVANSLVNLKETVEELDPVNFDFTAAGTSRLLQRIPFIGKPINKYFTKYLSAQTVIDAIIKSLQVGRDQLVRDNKTLAFDQEQMKNSHDRLIRAIQLGKLLDDKLQYKLDREISPENDQHAFVQEELLFPLRQRIMDLQQTLAVNQQGVLTIEVIIRNNRELIRGVDRALNVTITALQVAVACALALANQEIVLNKIEAINKTTSNLIAHTAERLKTKGVAIHKQATQTMLNMQDLEKAFADIKTAMDDIAKFRREALPQMANNILRLDTLTKEAGKAIEKMEKGNVAQQAIVIDIE